MTDPCRLLVVCAHPDDETIHLGGTLARYAASGSRVVCVTATRGELGEIVDPALESAANRDRLGDIRMDEMGRALALLGPIERRWLGYRDSGMEGDPRNGDPEAFCRADQEEVAGRIARVIREVRPQVVVTLKTGGGGGHPDHLHAALATHLAFERAGDPGAWPDHLTGPDGLEPWTPSKLYETHGHTRVQLGGWTKLRYVVRDRGPIRALPVVARAVLRRRPAPQPVPAAVVEDQPAASTRIDVARWMAARDAAIRAYRTQIALTDELLALTPAELSRMSPTEDFMLQSGQAWPVPEDDLFAGLDCAFSEPARSSGPDLTG